MHRGTKLNRYKKSIKISSVDFISGLADAHTCVQIKLLSVIEKVKNFDSIYQRRFKIIL